MTILITVYLSTRNNKLPPSSLSSNPPPRNLCNSSWVFLRWELVLENSGKTDACVCMQGNTNSFVRPHDIFAHKCPQGMWRWRVCQTQRSPNSPRALPHFLRSSALGGAVWLALVWAWIEVTWVTVVMRQFRAKVSPPSLFPFSRGCGLPGDVAMWWLGCLTSTGPRVGEKKGFIELSQWDTRFVWCDSNSS